jgi:enterochelin esterase family protein
VLNLKLSSKILVGNALKDPVDRSVAVFQNSTHSKGKPLLVVYLPGFGGSSDDALGQPQPWQALVDNLSKAGVDAVIAVVDGRNRYGCSQYINSASSGRYMDYICREIVPLVEKQTGAGGAARRRIVAGHSSGGFGALRLGMARQKLFGGVVALSPDSYFDVTHKPFTLSDDTKKANFQDVQRMGPPDFYPTDELRGDASYCLALCADYAPKRDDSGQFEWLYDAKEHYRPEVYKRWLDNDPAVISHRLPHPFGKDQSVYLDGAAQDDFQANVGAQKVYDEISRKQIKCVVEFPPGHHSDHVMERIENGIRWLSGLSLNPIQP